MIESEIKPIGNTMYRSQQFDEDNSFLKILAVFLLVPVMLLAARFINLGLWYNVTKMELSNNTQLKQVGDYTFLGYSSYKSARVKTINTAQLSTKKLTVCVFFNWFHPAIFLAHNEGARIFINLGRVAVYPVPGLTSYFIHLADILETGKETNPPKALFFGSALFPKFIKTIAAKAAALGGVGESPAPSAGKGLSFVVNAIEDTEYLHIPYMIYFYLPLLLIIGLASRYGSIFFLSLFYYVGMFFLFDFQNVLFRIPFSWLIKLLGVEISDTVASMASAVLVVLFVIIAVKGVFRKRKKHSVEDLTLNLWGKGFIFFFILLPLFLRF